MRAEKLQTVQQECIEFANPQALSARRAQLALGDSPELWAFVAMASGANMQGAPAEDLTQASKPVELRFRSYIISAWKAWIQTPQH